MKKFKAWYNYDNNRKETCKLFSQIWEGRYLLRKMEKVLKDWEYSLIKFLIHLFNPINSPPHTSACITWSGRRKPQYYWPKNLDS